MQAVMEKLKHELGLDVLSFQSKVACEEVSQKIHLFIHGWLTNIFDKDNLNLCIFFKILQQRAYES